VTCSVMSVHVELEVFEVVFVMAFATVLVARVLAIVCTT